MLLSIEMNLMEKDVKFTSCLISLVMSLTMDSDSAAFALMSLICVKSSMIATSASSSDLSKLVWQYFLTVTSLK